MQSTVDPGALPLSPVVSTVIEQRQYSTTFGEQFLGH
jgi:hypothetical protein